MRAWTPEYTDKWSSKNPGSRPTDGVEAKGQFSCGYPTDLREVPEKPADAFKKGIFFR